MLSLWLWSCHGQRLYQPQAPSVAPNPSRQFNATVDDEKFIPFAPATLIKIYSRSRKLRKFKSGGKMILLISG